MQSCASPVVELDIVDTAPTVPEMNLAPDNARACLVLIHPAGRTLGSRFPLKEATCRLGREPANDVCLRDPTISRRHACIERVDGDYRILDLGSSNGTYVNNQRVAEHELADGDYVRLGANIFRFLAGGNIEAQYHEEIYRLSVVDALTGIPNRRYLEEFLERELSERQSVRPVALILFDIDHFKRINDQFGHLAGDATLQHLAERLRPLLRKGDLFARYGGEEFAICLRDCPQARAVAVAERLRARVAEEPFRFEEQEFPVTISAGIGFSVGGEKGLTGKELIRRADRKLYEAKSKGRNCVVA
jgi:diguanylate cyclase (GGDEF)-like protein